MSFLQGLRQIVYQALGSCPFTDEPVEQDLVDEKPAMPVNWPVANAASMHLAWPFALHTSWASIGLTFHPYSHRREL